MKTQPIIITAIIMIILIGGSLFFLITQQTSTYEIPDTAGNKEIITTPIETDSLDNTNEKPIEITPTTQEFRIEADDNAFYMNNEKISSMTVNKGNNIKILFEVRTKNVYFGGLDFRGSNGIKTKGVKPGESTTFEFIADKNILISSFWPSSSQLKDTLKVNVE